MKLIRILFKRSLGAIAIAVIAGIVTGSISILLLYIINTILKNQSWNATAVWTFALLCLIRLLSGIASHILIVRLTANITYDMCMHFCEGILEAPLIQLEKIGTHRLMAVFSQDISNVANTVLILPNFFVCIIIVLSGLIYMGSLSWNIGLLLFVFIGIGVATYLLPIFRVRYEFRKAREETDFLFGHFQLLADGIKELKLHKERRKAFLNHVLRHSAGEVKDRNIKAITIHTIASNWNRSLFFIYVGLLIFVFSNFFSISSRDLPGYILILLYIMPPLEAIQNSLPSICRANVAFKKIQNLGFSLFSEVRKDNIELPVESSNTWQTLELNEITHTYKDEYDDSPFVLGPITLKFQPGELIFLIGGNGSGKSTLAKNIVGLYTPETGQIRLDGKLITNENRESYRQLFTAIFADFSVFETLPGFNKAKLNSKIKSYLMQFHLRNKITFNDNGVFGASKLSRGQRKRLALVMALLEDRPFYVFDEWAADQDSFFREVFYEQILPRLKSTGKTILVITHDDRYFHLADRVIKLELGKICKSTCLSGTSQFSKSSKKMCHL